MFDTTSAGSNFWQLRLIVSWQSSGAVVWSLHGKSKDERWQDVADLQRGVARLGHVPQGSIHEGLECMEEIIRAELLPRD